MLLYQLSNLIFMLIRSRFINMKPAT